MSPTYFWLGAFVLFGAVEAATAGLTSIWFALGALATLVASAMGAQTWLQVTIFILVSAAAVAATRPLARRFAAGKKVATNADRVIGRTARVTEAIDNLVPAGAVYADGKTWTARSADGAAIPAGAMVTVLAMEGVKLIVRERKEAVTMKDEEES